MGYPPASQASRAHPSTGHMVDPGQAMAAQFYQPGGAMAQGAHPGHTAAAQASSLARLTQMTHSLTDLPGLPGAQAVPGHPVPQPAPPGPASTSSKSTPPAAPPTTPAPQAAAAPAGHPALLPHGYPYPPPPRPAPPCPGRPGQGRPAPDRPAAFHQPRGDAAVRADVQLDGAPAVGRPDLPRIWRHVPKHVPVIQGQGGPTPLLTPP